MTLFKSAIILSALTSVVAFATPTDKSLNELAPLVGYEASFYEAVVTPLISQRTAIIESMAADQTLTEDQRKKAIDAFDKYAQGLLKDLDSPKVKAELKKAYIQAAKSTFTQAEVDAQIAFYGSKDGKSAVTKQETVYDKYIKAAGDGQQKTINDYVNKNAKKMQDDIKKILKK